MRPGCRISGCGAQDIHAVRDGFEVARVDARRIPAQMVDG
jgi:hypothetical protein